MRLAIARPIIVSHRITAPLLILVVSSLALAISLQGWRAVLPSMDLLPYYDRVDALFQQGKLPERGTLTSLGSFTPPGTAWLVLPGMLAFNDPRLYDTIGAGLLFVLTLVGIYIVAKRTFGTRTAALAVILYGLSELGLYFARSLWPRGHPVFFIWMVYFGLRWVEEKRVRWLAMAIVVWAIGMYVFLEIGPALLMLPVLWLLYRPPVRLVPIIIASVLSLSVWFPYLAFQYERDFADIRSQLFREHLVPGTYRSAYCDPAIPMERINGPIDYNEIVANVRFGNLSRVARFPGVSIALLSLLLGGSLVSLRKCDLPGRVILLSLAVAWGTALLIVEAYRPERLWWLWPLQLIVLCAAVTVDFKPAFRVAQRVATMLLIAAVAINPTLVKQVSDWMSDGWAGSDAALVETLAFVASSVGKGRNEIKIGYEIATIEFMASYHIADPGYRVGALPDRLMRDRHGIVNTNRCAEGVASHDQYRIVQVGEEQSLEYSWVYFKQLRDADLVLLNDAGPYHVYHRSTMAR